MEQQPKQHGILFHLLDVLFNIVVIVAVVAAIRTFLVSPFQVEGNSMLDTLHDKEYIVINKLAYHIGEPQRGDVVVFHPPTEQRSKYYVKRVIGLPGDTVTIRDGYVYVREAGSNQELQLPEETYLNERNLGNTYRHPPTGEDTDAISYKVPEGSYFLLGDNREGSYDSRSFALENGQKPVPFVPRRAIKGRVWFVALPITKIHAIEPPPYAEK